jgi:hypothetical protein
MGDIVQMKSGAPRSVAATILWLVVIIQLGMILSELSTLERVIRNIDSTTVDIMNYIRTH